MKLIDFTQKPAPDTPIQRTWERLQAALPFGQTENKSKEAVLARFERFLDNRYTMVHGLDLGLEGDTGPYVLVGPMGILSINLNTDAGIFRAKDDTWWELDRSTRKFHPAHTNRIRQTLVYARAVGGYFEALGKSYAEVTPLLIFAHPGVHIDSKLPAVRIVLADGVERLIASLLQSEEVINPAELKLLSEPFERLLEPQGVKPKAEEDFFGKDLMVPEKPKPPSLPEIQLPETDLPLPPFLKQLKFTRLQWGILLLLVIFTVLILVGFILMMLITTA